MKKSNQLPAPRSIVEMIEDQTSFSMSIGDGDCIGGEIEGINEPVYIDFDEENPNEYRVHYLLASGDQFLPMLQKGMEIMQTQGAEAYTAHMNSMYWSARPKSVEELVQVLKSIA